MKTVGRYSIVAELKRSDKQATCKAWDPVDERFVLIKISLEPQPNLHDGDAGKQELLFENLRHENIVLPLDAGVEHIYPYSVFEFIEGPDLRAIADRVERLPIDITTWILHDLLDGLAFLHAQNILHRDIKPENIMLASTGTVKLCDFDLASRIGENRGNEQGLTGSFGYFSPEDILGDKIVPASDLFSLGVTIYELLTGARPFAGSSLANETRAITHRAHLPVKTLRPEIPNCLATFLDALLDKNAAKRPGDAAIALASLRALIQFPSSEQRRQAIRDFLENPAEYAEQPLELIQAPAAPSQPRKRSARMRTGLLLAGTLLVSAAAFFWWQQEGFAPPGSKASTRPIPLVDENAVQKEDVEKPAQETAETSREPARNEEPTTASSSPPPAEDTTSESAPPAADRRLHRFQGKSLTLRTSPWAHVFLNEDSLGTAENSLTFFVKAGEHQLRLHNPEMPELTLPITVTPDSPDTLNIDLWQYIARINLTITPYSEALYIDGKKRETPMTQFQLLLLPGEHDLLFVHPDLGSLSHTLQTEAGKDLRMQVNFFTKSISVE